MIEKRISIFPPPGVRRRGSKHASKNAWYDTDWVRWVEGALEPMEGLDSSTLFGTASYTPRFMTQRLTPTSTIYSVVIESDGGASSFRVTAGTIGIGGMVKISKVADSAGWGTQYGTAVPAWFGNTMLYIDPNNASNIFSGALYQWVVAIPAVANSATPVAGAPTGRGVVVTPERFAVVLCAGGDPKTVQWADQESLSVWTPAATNQAGNFILTTDGIIVGGRMARSETLIWTTTDLWAMTYVGPPAVYSFRQVGVSCGAATDGAITRSGEMFFWISPDGRMFQYDGVVRQLPMDDIIDLRPTTGQLGGGTFAFAHPSRSEVLFSPVVAGSAPTQYWLYNYVENWWAIGHYAISAMSGTEIGTSVAAGLADYATKSFWTFSRARSTRGDANVPYAETGALELGEGDQVVRLQKIVPDVTALTHLTLNVMSGMDPVSSETTTAVALSKAEADARLTARFYRFKWSEATTTDWRLAGVTAGVIPIGLR